MYAVESPSTGQIPTKPFRHHAEKSLVRAHGFRSSQPQRVMDLSLEKLGVKKEEALVIGDRLETDIAAGQNAGIPCALVLSGVSTKEEADAWQPKIDMVADSLNELVN